MPAHKSAPTLKRSKSSGHAYAYFDRVQNWFGHFDDPETHSRFAVFVARWEANGRTLPEEDGSSVSFLVEDLVAAYLRHAEVYYRKHDGSQSGEVAGIRHSLRPLLALFGGMPTKAFTLRLLKDVREKMILAGLSRKTVNKRISRIVHMFRWGTEEEFVLPAVFGALRALTPLKRGRSAAHEIAPVLPVDWNDVQAVLNIVSSPISSMILLQWYTGMRPGEVVCMNPGGINRRGKIWIYTPEHHKTEHHGRVRTIAIGPKAQDVLRPLLMRVPLPNDTTYLFSPMEALAERHASEREHRQTPIRPGHMRAAMKKKRAHPKSVPAEAYTVSSYRRAITRACKSAQIESWSPNRLRHSAATRIRREHGLEAARVVLGHTSASMTEVYAELDQQQALRVMADLG